jgi:hypothetical protein
MVDREDALIINTTTTTPATSMASIMAEVSCVATLVSTLAATNGGGGGDRGGGGTAGGGGGRRARKRSGKNKDGNPLVPKCPHCNKPATHKADNCFSLAKNEEKRKAAGFKNGKFSTKKEE